MKIYHSTALMIDELVADAWTKEIIPRGVKLIPPPSLGDGSLLIWGDPSSLCLIDMDLVFAQPFLSLNSSEDLSIQITFAECAEMEYYKDLADIQTGHFGSFCYINNVCIPWFKNYPAHKKIKALTLLISNDFLKASNIDLSLETWNRLAIVINQFSFSLPSLTTILKQIRQSTIDDSLFFDYLRSKSLEAFLLLYDFALFKEKIKPRKLSKKSHLAVKNALDILDKNFIYPPIIDDLAKMLDINAKTLQSSFKEIVGLSIHQYIRTLKLQKSLILLESDRLTIEQISKSVGYQSKIHFYKAFQSVFSMNPSEMKKLLTAPPHATHFD